MVLRPSVFAISPAPCARTDETSASSNSKSTSDFILAADNTGFRMECAAHFMSLEPGSKLGRYEIRSKLGAGGMGEVYRARDEKLNRDVAVKILPATLSENGDRLHRFEQEAQAAGALNHPNILAIYDVGTNESAPYVVSELLEGETLRECLEHGALSTRKAIDIGTQIARGLAAAHAKGIVHRDLKPDNLFITKDDHVKILA